MGAHDAVPEKRAGSAAKGFLEFVIMIVVALCVAFGLRHFVLEPFQVPSGSMESTIETGDYVLTQKVQVDPQPGDIVTFDDPTTPDRILIKRVIATEGQTVDLVDGIVYVDGVALDEPYTLGKPSNPLAPTYQGMSITYPYTVPAGCIWVMGDNRTNSSDSRYFGPVPADSVSGEAMVVYWPANHIGKLD